MSRERIKRQIYTHIPVYSGDVSGAASALYEFDGMTVIHDPSGCNSTYNTHDELRWMKRESAVYISGLKESDAINGNDSRLIDDTVSAALSLENRPRFIALCNSPVPDIIGTDFNAIAEIIEDRTGIPSFHVRTNAMHDYTMGASDAFHAIAEKFLCPGPDIETSDIASSIPHLIPAHTPGAPIRICLLGLTPFEYPDSQDVDRIFNMLTRHSFDIISDWGLGTSSHPVSFQDIEAAKDAEVSLVLSSTGIAAARYLYIWYGIPYVCGNPLASDDFGSIICDELRKAITTHRPSYPYIPILSERSGTDTAFIGEAVTMGSEAAAYALSHPDRKISLICTTELHDYVISDKTLCPRGEAEIASAMAPFDEIHGDPFLSRAASHGHRGYSPERQKWVDEPHLAMSGRIYLHDGLSL